MLKQKLAPEEIKSFRGAWLDAMLHHYLNDIKVVEGDKGLFVAMPSKRMPDGEYKDIAHPISSEVREVIQNAVLKEYEKALADLLTELTAELENR